MSGRRTAVVTAGLAAGAVASGAVGRALGDLGRPDVPLVLLGHSRGGRLAVEAAAFLNPRLVIAIFTCGAGGLIGLIEGIIYLTKSDDEFQRVYIEGKKAWF